ncbi:MAG: hypothetical protein JWO63_1227, partial [Frankiales bacterium]|nr:hypothetical protein [Frankiales bacterium]
LLGDVYRCNALWLPARENYLLGLRRAEERKDSGLIQLFRSELALVDGWTGESDPAKWDVPDLPRVGIWTEVSQLIAQALFASTRDEAQATRLLDGAEAIAENFGLHEGLSDVLIARGFLAALYGEDERLLAAAAALEERVDHSGTYASWLAVLQLWAGRDLDDRSTDVHWLGGPTAAAAGWTALLSRRIAEIH